ncbi:unnamed protein product [Rotaria socialis]|uniref:Uncharacterized protein n=1 Tax=Rotaria socialis TaxID=392032 RepID=A0A818NN78_9BILA|nr:unnamed protein product [Rotaria socialis]
MAIHFYEKSLEINRQILSPNHHYLASSYNGIGMAYMKKGVYVEALSSHEKSLQMFEKTLGPNDCHVGHHSLMTSYDIIRELHVKMQKYSKRQPLVVKNAIDLGQCSLPVNHLEPFKEIC